MSASELVLPRMRCNTAIPRECSKKGIHDDNDDNNSKVKSLPEKHSERSSIQFAPSAEMCSVWESEYPLVRYLYHRQPITHLLYSKRAHRYFSASSDGLVKMWKPDYHSLDSFGKPVIVHEKNLLRTRAEILSLTLTPLSVGSAEVLLVMCNDGTITLIRTVNGEVLRTLLGIRTSSINDAKAIYERHPFKRQSKIKSSDPISHYKDNEVDKKYGTSISNDVNIQREKDTNNEEIRLQISASSNKIVHKNQMSKLTNRERERELVQMSKVEARVLPYTIRAYHQDTVELCFGRSNKYFQGLPIVAPTYEHLIQPVYHTADLLFDYGKLTTSHSKHSYSRNNNNSNSDKQVKSNNVSVSQMKTEKECKNVNKEGQTVHSRQENWFATAIAITYHTSDGRHKNDAMCNSTIHSQHKTKFNTSCVEHDNTSARCENTNISSRNETESWLLTGNEWKDGVYLLLGFADGLVQVYHLNEKWFSTSHLSSTRVDPPIAFYPVTSLLVHEPFNNHSSYFMEQLKYNERAITMIVISESPEESSSAVTSAKHDNNITNTNSEVLHDNFHHPHRHNNSSANNTIQVADISFHQLVFIGCKDNTISIRHFDRLHVPLLILGNYGNNFTTKGNLLSSSNLDGDATSTEKRIVGEVADDKNNSRSSCNSKKQTTEKWNAKTRSHQLFGLSGHTKPITCYAWSNALELLVTGGRDYMLFFWSPRTSRPIRSIDCRAAHTIDNNTQDFVRSNQNSTRTNKESEQNNDDKDVNNNRNNTKKKDDHDNDSNNPHNYDGMTLQKHFVIYGYPISLSFVTRERNKTAANKDKFSFLQYNEEKQVWLLMLDNRHVIRIYDAADGTCLHTLLNNNEVHINTCTTSRSGQKHRNEQKEEKYQICKANNISNDNNNMDCARTDSKELSLPELQSSQNVDIASECSTSSNYNSKTYTTSQERSKQHATQKKLNKWQTKNAHSLLAICYDTEFERLLLGGYCINVWNTIERVETKPTTKTHVRCEKENKRLNEELVHEKFHIHENKEEEEEEEEEEMLVEHKLSHYGQSHENSTPESEDLFNGTLPSLVPPLRKKQTERWISSIHADMNDVVNIALPLPLSACHLHTTSTAPNEILIANNIHVDNAKMTNSYSNTMEYKDVIAANHITTNKNKSENRNSNRVYDTEKEHQSTVTEKFTGDSSKPPKSTFASPSSSFDFLSKAKEVNTNKRTESNSYASMSHSQSPCLKVNYRSMFNTQRVTSANNERQRRLGIGDEYRFTNNVMDDFDMNAVNMTNPFTLTAGTVHGDAFHSTDNTSYTKLPKLFHGVQENENNNTISNNDYCMADEVGDNDNNNGTREGAAVVMHNAYLHRRRQEALQQIMKINCDDADSVEKHKLAKNNMCGKVNQKKNMKRKSKKNSGDGTKKTNRHMTLEERLLHFTIHDSHLRHHSHAKHGKLSRQHRHAGLIKSKMKPYEVRRAIEAGLIHLASFTDFSDTGTSTVFFGTEKEISKDKYRNQSSKTIISQSFVRDALKQRNDKASVQKKNLHQTRHEITSLKQPHTENASREIVYKNTSLLDSVAEKWLTSHSPTSSFVIHKATSDKATSEQLNNNEISKDNSNNKSKEEEEERYENIDENDDNSPGKASRERDANDTKNKENTLESNNEDEEELNWYTRREMAAEQRRHAAALWHPARVMHTLMNWSVYSVPHESSTYEWQESSEEEEEQEELETRRQVGEQNDELEQRQEEFNSNSNKMIEEKHSLTQRPHVHEQVAVPNFLPKVLHELNNEESVKYAPFYEPYSYNNNANLQSNENKKLTSIPWWEEEINAAQTISGKRINAAAAVAASTRENVALLLAEAEVERIEQQIESKYIGKRELDYEQEEEGKKKEEEHIKEKGITNINNTHSITSLGKSQGDAYDSTVMPSTVPYKNSKKGKAIRIETFGQLKERINNKKVDLPGGVCKPQTKFVVH